MTQTNHTDTLPAAHKAFYDRVRAFLPAERVILGPFRNLALGDDASFYRLVPKIVVKAVTQDEVAKLLRAASVEGVAVTFRTAGTSLSGQALTDSVLIYLAGHWKGFRVHPGAGHISLEPGVIGAEANFQLAPYGRKIGPDPASISACMIGGIAANNSSGMCCGTAENSYKTVESMRLVFADGEMLDTADPVSKARFAAVRKPLLDELAAMRAEILADAELAERIRRKFKIKNTTGYGINAFVDFDDPFDILLHLIIGSEGTLAFISEVTYRTVVEHPFKASSLMIYPDIDAACRATIALKAGPVAAVELMDRASLRSVEDKPGMPAYLKELSEAAAAILVEVRAADKPGLLAAIDGALSRVAGIEPVFPLLFMDAKDDYEKLWNIRRGLFTSVGGARQPGSAVIIEDVVFPIENLAEGTVELQRLMHVHGFPEGIIFGHALEGNLHFVFCPDFGDPAAVANYQKLMDEVAAMVVGRYEGSLKGEHGTGRNMAPFVEMEWGKTAYGFMHRLKRAFDPDGILNPGVILNDDPNVYLKNLKPLPEVNPLIDRCIECGYCESVCPSRNVTTTPRQRITLQRHMALAKKAGDLGEFTEFHDAYDYFGSATCAADGLCATVCPVSVDTGMFTKDYRRQEASPRGKKIGRFVADHYGLVTWIAGRGLWLSNVVHGLIGTPAMTSMTYGLRKLSGGLVPFWTPYAPKAGPKVELRNTCRGHGRKVVYFPSCTTRAMGPSALDPDQRGLFEATMSVLAKAGYDVIFPEAMNNLCCGLTLESKGMHEDAARKSRELEAVLRKVSDNGAIPILCDASPCLYTMRCKMEPGLKLHEPVEFIHDYCLPHLDITPVPDTVAVHVSCSSVKMGLTAKFAALAERCAGRVVVPRGIHCCGFAGDRGFFYPELNASALADLPGQLPATTTSGYSNSRTCEIGLSYHGGVPYQSIVYLVDRAAQPKA
ncbi:FAD-binding and (Fe-S)-binding domain-containing protein [Desulfovibrio sp. TomC]|uniref:FAD-binding and (Fe-S)-binding domain-containing protein n=1 Tax=Desulfovibrio sp. TomC TaxID=1562888 RepID=UPI000573B439|nr:FAD-binding and (Fe-S)-binding domain-containing protein [Desulfovibrio sp. TomC]KHK04521.1 putative D-lactate dehydrogenase, Fe-S protein, FAD/FMN-containing [Desulfovibrio sp. TomC]